MVTVETSWQVCGVILHDFIVYMFEISHNKKVIKYPGRAGFALIFIPSFTFCQLVWWLVFCVNLARA